MSDLRMVDRDYGMVPATSVHMSDLPRRFDSQAHRGLCKLLNRRQDQEEDE